MATGRKRVAFDLDTDALKIMLREIDLRRRNVCGGFSFLKF